MNGDDELLAAEANAKGRFSLAGSANWSIANRVSYHIELHGPSLSVDTACSSSLTALHLAVASLRRGECRIAIAGGVNLIHHPPHFRRLCSTHRLTRDDRCPRHRHRARRSARDRCLVDGLSRLHRALALLCRRFDQVQHRPFGGGGWRGGAHEGPAPTQHQTLVASLHAETPNPRIAFQASPFSLQREAAACRRPSTDARRRACLSSFYAERLLEHLMGGLRSHLDWPLLHDVQESDVEMDVDVSQYGLDSINVMLLLGRMKEEFGVNIDASELVARRTWRELAGFVMARRNIA